MEICVGCERETIRYHVLITKTGPIYLCHRCYKHPEFDRRLTTFPFTTTHFDGHERTVNSMRHLRQLEREHGVAAVAYNADERNFRDAPQQRFPQHAYDPRISGGQGRRE